MVRHTALILASLVLTGAGTLHAQQFPTKPIRVITSALGSVSDLTARIIGQGITENVGQQVIVDNRGIIGVEIAAKSPPDGYTVIAYGSPLWLSPLLQKSLGWDALRDFVPVSLTNVAPNLVIVHPSLPVKSVKDLIVLAQARPRDLNYGSGSSGSASHMAAELFKSMARVDIVRIPYKGSGPALNALIAGEVQVMFPNAGPVMPHIKAGRLRALAVASAEPSSLAPGLPTVSASGLPGYESISPEGIFAPAKTPQAIVDRLNQEIVRALSKAEVRERLFSVGVEVVASTPEKFAATVRSEVVRMARLIKDVGIGVE